MVLCRYWGVTINTSERSTWPNEALRRNPLSSSSDSSRIWIPTRVDGHGTVPLVVLSASRQRCSGLFSSELPTCGSVTSSRPTSAALCAAAGRASLIRSTWATLSHLSTCERRGGPLEPRSSDRARATVRYCECCRQSSSLPTRAARRNNRLTRFLLAGVLRAASRRTQPLCIRDHAHAPHKSPRAPPLHANLCARRCCAPPSAAFTGHRRA